MRASWPFQLALSSLQTNILSDVQITSLEGMRSKASTDQRSRPASPGYRHPNRERYLNSLAFDAGSDGINQNDDGGG
jgi:hypothetical protein